MPKISPAGVSLPIVIECKSVVYIVADTLAVTGCTGYSHIKLLDDKTEVGFAEQALGSVPQQKGKHILLVWYNSQCYFESTTNLEHHYANPHHK